MTTQDEKLVDMDGDILDNSPSPAPKETNEDLSQDADFIELARKFDKTAQNRDIIITKLMEEFTKANLTFDQKADNLIAKVAAIGAITTLLKDSDAQAKEYVKLKLNKQEQDVNGASAKLITDCLNQLNKYALPSNASSGVPANADDKIDELFKDKCKPILPGELIPESKSEAAQ